MQYGTNCFVAVVFPAENYSKTQPDCQWRRSSRVVAEREPSLTPVALAVAASSPLRDAAQTLSGANPGSAARRTASARVCTPNLAKSFRM